ncbi:N-acetylneuraminate lyase [Ereboglobus sp. PH5-10]|uniref:dihydrodipicolinate synthase family protein n=1 Tax=Ereboglobus sp. PH5-10 TaxID=2940629 RepID=UPI0024070A65|nr:dihydrodipicolinate synthase family protein [Ereboglobus sp. PH5-10]MDF9828036.1 N-acetylneuraminate lyase [Ereboglobus sp. PH5-10]
MSNNNPAFHITGLIAAPFTPFDAKGRLKLGVIPKLVKYYKATGVSGAFVCGTTGEGASMSNEERFAVAKAWGAAMKGSRLKLIVHVGHNSLPESCALAAHAEKIGADAIATIAPSFFRPEGVDGLVEWCKKVATAAPKTPFYYYHMPSMSGVNVAMADFLPLAAKSIRTFGGIKFTHENIMDYGLTLAAAGDKYDILFGRDEILLSALVMGAKGAVGSTYNYASALYNRVIAAYNAGDMKSAAAWQLESMKFIQAFCKHGGMSANKAILGLLGMDCGPVRPPMTPIAKDKIAAMKADLEEAGFFKNIRP